MLFIKRYEPDKVCLIEKKVSNSPWSQGSLIKLTPSDSAYQKIRLQKCQAFIYKNAEFCVFRQKEIMDGCLFVVFSSGVITPN